MAMVLLCAPAAGASTYGQVRPETTRAVALASPGVGGRLPDGPVPAESGAGVPAPIVALAVFAGLFLLAAAVGGVARLFGWSPAWAIAWRHSWKEAEYRITGGWLSLRDRFKRNSDRPPS